MKNKLFINKLPLETKRLIIKPTTKEDINLILKLDKQEKTQEFLGGIKNKTKEERLEFLNKKEQKFQQGIASSLTVYLKDIEEPIAFIGIKIDEDTSSAEISYIFDEEHTGKGYCTESVEKLIEVAFNDLNLTKIYADTVTANENSKKVLLRVGFKHIGTKVENDVLFDEYELLNENLQ